VFDARQDSDHFGQRIVGTGRDLRALGCAQFRRSRTRIGSGFIS
jgi:hypothetical protein